MTMDFEFETRSQSELVFKILGYGSYIFGICAGIPFKPRFAIRLKWFAQLTFAVDAANDRSRPFEIFSGPCRIGACGRFRTLVKETEAASR